MVVRKDAKMIKIKRNVIAAASLVTMALVSAPALAALKATPILQNMVPTEKPYQLKYVGNDEQVAPEFRNSVFVSSFGSIDGKAGEDLLDSKDADLEEGKRFAIQGYARFIQVKDNNEVIRWDFKDYPADANAGENKKATKQDFLSFMESYNSPNAKPLSVLNYLQPLHSLDYAKGKIVGQQTFIGKYIIWDISKPAKSKQGFGELKLNENVKVNKGSAFDQWQQVRVRLAQFSPDSETIFSVVRGEEENPTEDEFSVDVTYFPTYTVSSDAVLKRMTIKGASTGHALDVHDNVLYTGGTDIRRYYLNSKEGKVEVYQFAGEINFGKAAPSFLNIIVDDENNRVYALNSRDADPEEVDAKNYQDYQDKFKEFAIEHKQGLYVFSRSGDKILKLEKFIPMIQPVELVLDKKNSKVFVTDRMAKELVEVDTKKLEKTSTVSFACHVSNLTKGADRSLYVTSVYSFQLSLVGAGEHGCNSISRVTY